MGTQEATIAAEAAMAAEAIASTKAAQEKRALAMRVFADRQDAIDAGRDPGPRLADYLAGTVAEPEPEPGPKPVWIRIPRSGEYAWRPDGKLSDDDLATEDYIAKIRVKQAARALGLDVVPVTEEPEPEPEKTPAELAMDELRGLVDKRHKSPEDFARISQLRGQI